VRSVRSSHPARREAVEAQVDQELLIEKEHEIHELRETIEILEQKVTKLEHLVRLKDAKIHNLKERVLGGGTPARSGS